MHEINVDPMNKMSPTGNSYSHPVMKKGEHSSEQPLGAFLEDVESIKPNKKYVSFREAHEFAKSLKLRTRKEWRLYVKDGLDGKTKKPNYIPAHPDGIYKVKGWQGWKYWLGTADKSML